MNLCDRLQRPTPCGYGQQYYFQIRGLYGSHKSLLITEVVERYSKFKVLNDNIQVEINAAKMALASKNEAHNFGRIVGMGQRLIGNSGEQSA